MFQFLQSETNNPLRLPQACPQIGDPKLDLLVLGRAAAVNFIVFKRARQII
jgi:hypothetical protein